jgi:hypothetical protein
MRLTLDISDELAARLSSEQARLPQILALGLREVDAEDACGFRGLADVLEFLADLPTPEQILALRPSQNLQQDIVRLLERSREASLNAADERQWRQYQYIEHLVRKAKIRAAIQLSKT